MSINRWTDKETVVHIYNGILRACWVTQSNPTLCNPMDCSLPVSSVHGIIQARILAWVSISHSRGSSWPRGRSCMCCTSRWILYHCATWEAFAMEYYSAIKRNKTGSSVAMQMNLESVIQNEVSQKEKNKYWILAHIYMESRKMMRKNL